MTLENSKKKEREGLSLRRLNYIMSTVTVVISIIMLISLYMTARGYGDVRDDTEDFIICDRSANALQFGSDYLTEQVRAFAVTGHKEHLDNYFIEANVTKRRDNALTDVKKIIGETTAYRDLEKAMENSVALMEREYYAMKLTALAYDIDLAECPEEVRDVKLTDGDAALSKDKMAELARSMVFDSVYKEYKRIISEATQSSIGHLTELTEKTMERSLEKLNVLLIIQRILVVVLVIVIAGIIAITSVQVIRPLTRAVPRIKNEKPLALDGAYEYKFLAKTYNKMYETNRAQKKKLKYEATHDILTGTFNRAGFESICEAGMLTDYAVLIIDLDNFKQINDTYGHGVGDRILMKVANEFKRAFRVSDYICRIGGDEFSVLMNAISLEKDREAVIKDKIYRINDSLANGDDGLPVISVSAGVAFGDADSDINRVIKHADEALYEVKNNGRHNVTFHTGE